MIIHWLVCLIALLPLNVASQPSASAPDLQVSTIDGKQWKLQDQRGRWVVINFWATWCSPCLKEMPELSQLHTDNAAIEVIGLAYEEIEAAQMVAFLAEHPVSYPIAVIDPFAPLADFAPPRGLPMSLVFAPDGTLFQQFLGTVTAESLEQVIAENEGKIF